MQEHIFIKEYEVRSYDTNPSGNLSLRALFGYLQDIAGLHADKLHFGRDDLNSQKQFWALSRIICRLKAVPVWNDRITITTWPKGVEGVFAIRNFKMHDSESKLMGEASSSWIIVDSDTRRPIRPGEILKRYIDNNPFDDFECPLAGKIPSQSENAYRSPVQQVRYSDLDINIHVNNANYLKWIIDSYPLEFFRNNTPFEVEVNYLTETVPGDEYYVTAEQKENTFYHSVVKANSKTVSCRVRIRWEPCG